MRISLCKGCGKPIVWALITKNGVRTGKRVPLDPLPIIYKINGFDEPEYEAHSILQADGMCSHFVTCPKANEFSGKNKRK